ncbi:serine hydrolase [uncultured Dokdonia sp.]|uniref:serine hydrolase n=1 Tax=uncultured Dokdonia sp. TaxID=575653 RepID=UPI0026244037|nr:serine hydrolase [uncultured Dokdonia sp.]
MRISILLGCVSSVLVLSCTTPLDSVLTAEHPAIRTVMDSLENHEVQILYTQIDTTDKGLITFKDYVFQENKKNYFYPASTVKLPIALLATEYINTHPEIELDTPYISERDSVLHSVSDDIRQIFAVSDNEAYNRLYDLLGRDYINTRLKELALSPTRISHRLSTTNADKAERGTIKFFPSYEGDIITIEEQIDQPIVAIKIKKQQKGKGYLKDSTQISTPFDFSDKNYFPLKAQHELMKRVFFEDQFDADQRFNISYTDKIRIQKAMYTLPRKAKYDPETYYDSYVKFFLYGDSKDPIPDHIKIYNKVGYAYGTLTETAYVVDEKEGIQFLLSATILVNKNEIFNDDTYEYDTIGIPFLAQLGREIYALEKNRK